MCAGSCHRSRVQYDDDDDHVVVNHSICIHVKCYVYDVTKPLLQLVAGHRRRHHRRQTLLLLPLFFPNKQATDEETKAAKNGAGRGDYHYDDRGDVRGDDDDLLPTKFIRKNAKKFHPKKLIF